MLLACADATHNILETFLTTSQLNPQNHAPTHASNLDMQNHKAKPRYRRAGPDHQLTVDVWRGSERLGSTKYPGSWMLLTTNQQPWPFLPGRVIDLVLATPVTPVAPVAADAG